MLQKMSAAAIALMLLTTMVPEIPVMAAETEETQAVGTQETAKDASETEETAEDKDTETEADDSTAEDVAAASDLTGENEEQVSSRNYALYTEMKEAGTEEVKNQQEAAAQEAAAQAAAAQAAAEAAAAKEKAEKAAKAAQAAQAAKKTSASTSTGRYSGRKLTRSAGTVQGPSGKEVYYNMNMSVVVSVLKRKGYSGSYWVRSDGVKMFGNYVMVAANYRVHPYGSIVQTTLGAAIVCDTGTFASSYPNCLDVAVSW